MPSASKLYIRISAGPKALLALMSSFTRFRMFFGDVITMLLTVLFVGEEVVTGDLLCKVRPASVPFILLIYDF